MGMDSYIIAQLINCTLNEVDVVRYIDFFIYIIDLNSHSIGRKATEIHFSLSIF